MKVWISNNKDRLQKVLLGSIPTSKTLQGILKKPIPKVIEKVLAETQEDLDQIKGQYEKLGVEVLSYPVETLEDSINVRNGFIVVDDHMWVSDRSDSLRTLYNQIDQVTFLGHNEGYCPDIYIHDEYAILDRLPPMAFEYWRKKLSVKRKIITAFNEGHSDGIYCNVGDKIWLTNGQALPFKKHWPGVPVMELSTSNKGLINDWEPVEKMFRSKELHKTQGRYLIAKNELNKTDIEFIDEYLDKWLGYCEETLFDINLSIIDDKNVMAISQNSLVYDRLESLDIKVHKVPFRHRFFWDGGLHCITNDLVRKS
jgi:hypothetical protein|tara:strand:+ start:1798 stop:2733 length:936 start_codon:yes stop_codon:yes gene_type:complete